MKCFRMSEKVGDCGETKTYQIGKRSQPNRESEHARGMLESSSLKHPAVLLNSEPQIQGVYLPLIISPDLC